MDLLSNRDVKEQGEHVTLEKTPQESLNFDSLEEEKKFRFGRNSEREEAADAEGAHRLSPLGLQEFVD